VVALGVGAAETSFGARCFGAVVGGTGVLTLGGAAPTPGDGGVEAFPLGVGDGLTPLGNVVGFAGAAGASFTTGGASGVSVVDPSVAASTLDSGPSSARGTSALTEVSAIGVGSFSGAESVSATGIPAIGSLPGPLSGGSRLVSVAPSFDCVDRSSASACGMGGPVWDESSSARDGCVVGWSVSVAPSATAGSCPLVGVKLVVDGSGCAATLFILPALSGSRLMFVVFTPSRSATGVFPSTDGLRAPGSAPAYSPSSGVNGRSSGGDPMPGGGPDGKPVDARPPRGPPMPLMPPILVMAPPARTATGLNSPVNGKTAKAAAPLPRTPTMPIVSIPLPEIPSLLWPSPTP
jgi:hypothetical protein